ncbi:MAG: polysaccharide biosynthesis/export family protein [Bacteroidales bacterium]|nr:polysaccharide biosynthesis/export family protein [Bacteroidales bacterium]
MKSLRHIKSLVLTLLVVVSATSCITPRRINYLQDMTHGSQIQIEDKFEAVIAPYDKLSIRVSTSSVRQELTTPFNKLDGDNMVDINGDILLPVLGKVHVAGLTRLRLQDTLTTMLREGGYLEDPIVIAHFTNFKIFYLGPDGRGRVINIPDEKAPFMEVLARMGGLDNYTRRDKIGVMREINGKMVMRYLDPRSTEVFKDPFYMLQQNDFIIVEAYGVPTALQQFSFWTGMIGTFASLASLITSFALYRSISK